MLDALLAFLKDPTNRETVGWVGAGIAAVAGGLWAVIKFFVRKGGDNATPNVKNVKADRGSVAIGGNNINSRINPNPRRSNKR